MLDACFFPEKTHQCAHIKSVGRKMKYNVAEHLT